MTEEIRGFESLISAVQPIMKVMDEVDRLRPPGFNIFEILGLAHAEVRTHSALLAYLLDPNEGHGQGTLFLEGFVDILRERERKHRIPSVLAEEVTRDWSCDAECYLRGARIALDSPLSWGQADIVIRAPGRLILVENKIYAGDQEQQMYRYWRYAREQSLSYLLVYLTPNGMPPSLNSLSVTPKVMYETGLVDDSPENHLVLLSYHTDIRLWLHRATERVSAISVAEVIRQYINLIWRL